MTIPPMPPTVDRRPYDPEQYPGYLEGNLDWAANNNGAVEWLADNHAAIRAAFSTGNSVKGATGTAKAQGWPLDPDFIDRITEEAEAETGYGATRAAAGEPEPVACTHDWEKTREDLCMFVCSKCRAAFSGNVITNPPPGWTGKYQSSSSANPVPTPDGAVSGAMVKAVRAKWDAMRKLGEPNDYALAHAALSTTFTAPHGAEDGSSKEDLQRYLDTARRQLAAVDLELKWEGTGESRIERLQRALAVETSATPTKQQGVVGEALHNARVLITALTGPDDAIAQATLANITAALQAGEADGWRLPRLTERMMRAACNAHYGSDNIDGIDLTADDINWSFREAFKRMWAGIRLATKAKGDR